MARTRETAQWLKALAAPPEDLSQSRTHIRWLTTVLKLWIPCLSLLRVEIIGYISLCVTDIFYF